MHRCKLSIVSSSTTDEIISFPSLLSLFICRSFRPQTLFQLSFPKTHGGEENLKDIDAPAVHERSVETII